MRAARPLVPLLVLLLAACGHHARPERPVDEGSVAAPSVPDDDGIPDSGLYAPEIPDSAPEHAPDLSDLVEPTPKPEPRSRYGNHSPYKVLGKVYRVLDNPHGYSERGVASWYGNKFHGRPTSSFEPYDMYAFTAAHKTLPLPTYARVTNLENGRSVVVRVNDRGPFVADRLIDLSYAAAVRLGVVERGTARVEVRALDPSETEAALSAPVIDPQGAVGAEPAPRPPVQPEPAIWLQVASFNDRVHAERLVRRLRETLDLAAKVQPAQVGGRSVFRVRLGPLPHPADADPLAERIVAAGFPAPRTFTE